MRGRWRRGSDDVPVRRAGLVLLWVLATGTVSAVAFRALSVAEAGVNDRPLVPVVVASETPTTSSNIFPTGPDSTLDVPGTSGVTSTPPSSTSTSSPGPTVSSTQPATTSITSTTTTTGEAWEVRVVSSNGGTVTVSHRPGEVVLQAAVPEPGYEVEVEDPGPAEVRVAFEGEDDEWEVRVRWSDGELDVEVSHKGGGTGEG